MSLNLKKGSRFNLAKESPKLKIAGIGLGWKPNEEPGGPNFDLDVSAFLIGEDGKVPTDDYVVFYGSELVVDNPEGKRPYSGDGAVLGAVDAIEGTDSDDDEVGDDEDMRIHFDKVWEGIQQIIISVSITKYPNDVHKDKRTLPLNFGMVQDCYIRLWDDETGVEIFKYDLKENFSNEDALEFGRFYKVGNSWEFIASGKGYTGSLQKLIDMFT